MGTGAGRPGSVGPLGRGPLSVARALAALALLGLGALGYARAIAVVERTYGARWPRWRWWAQLPFWAAAALIAAILGGPGWASLVLVAGGLLAVVLLTQRSLRRGG